MEKLVKQIIKRSPDSKLINWPKNWGFKLLSLFFAIFLWYFVAGEDKIDTNVFIPVELVNLPRDLVVSNQYKKQLEVTISGPRGLINGIAKQHISRTVNLTQAKPGTMSVHNDPESISLPRGITILRIQPTHMTLLIDRLIEKDLPIRAVVTGKPAPGFELTAVKLDPALMSLSGPQAILGDISYLSTSPIDINELKGSTTQQVTLELKTSIADLVGEPVVSARVIVNEKMIEKVINKIPVSLLMEGEQYRYHLKPSTITIRVKAPENMVKEERHDLAKFIQAHISVENLTAGNYTLPVKAAASGKVEIVSFSPQTVTARVSAAPSPKPKKK